ncbi:MAG: NTP transferase domain-containing protein [Thermoplasmata archaeon]
MLGIIMAGGKSSRMGSEKLVLKVHGKVVIEYAIEAMQNSKVSEYYIAISPNASLTARYLGNRERLLDTQGNGYCEDIALLISRFKVPFLTLSGDSMFVKSTHIDELIDHYTRNSMASVVIVDNKINYVGLNIVVPGNIDDEPYYFKDPLLALNINTREDLERADSIMAERSREK